MFGLMAARLLVSCEMIANDRVLVVRPTGRHGSRQDPITYIPYRCPANSAINFYHVCRMQRLYLVALVLQLQCSTYQSTVTVGGRQVSYIPESGIRSSCHPPCGECDARNENPCGRRQRLSSPSSCHHFNHHHINNYNSTVIVNTDDNDDDKSNCFGSSCWLQSAHVFYSSLAIVFFRLLAAASHHQQSQQVLLYLNPQRSFFIFRHKPIKKATTACHQQQPRYYHPSNSNNSNNFHNTPHCN